MLATANPLDRRPVLRRMHRTGVLLLCGAFTLVVAYLGFALVLSFRNPTILTSGEEMWQRAMRFDASQPPVFPKYIDALWMDRLSCDQCPQNWLYGAIIVPAELAGEVTAVELTDEHGEEVTRFIDPPAKQPIRDSRRSLLTEALSGHAPTETGWKLGEWLLAEMEPKLATVRALATQKPLGFVPAIHFDDRTTMFFGKRLLDTASQLPIDDPWSASTRACQYPIADTMIDLTQWFLLDARHAANRGDGQRVCEDLAAVMGLADQIDENPSILAQVRSFTMRKWTWHEARDIVLTWPKAFDEAALAQLEAMMLRAGDGPLPLHLDGIRLDVEDMLQRSFTTNSAGGERVDGSVLSGSALAALDINRGSFSGAQEEDAVAAFILGPVIWAVMPTRQEVDALFKAELTQLESECRLHPADRKPVVVPPVTFLDPGRGIIARYVHNFRLTMERLAAWQGERDGARLAIAAERFRRTEGREPTSVPELVPKYVREVPRDVITGLPRTRLDGRKEEAEADPRTRSGAGSTAR
jgi:hypothetical protein